MEDLRLSGSEVHDAMKRRTEKLDDVSKEHHWVLGRLAHIHSEVSEAYCAVMRQDHELFAREMADIILYTCDLCHCMGIDIEHVAHKRLAHYKSSFAGNPY